MDLSISIIAYNRIDNIAKCITSIQEHTTGVSYEVIIVAYRFGPENLSTLRSMFPTARIIESNEIRGFAENQNLALRSATGRYCLILNDDTFVIDNMIATLIKTLDALPGAGLVSPLLLNPDLTVQQSGRGRYRLLNWFLPDKRGGSDPRATATGIEGVFRTAAVSGSCFMARRGTLADVGFFCEDYFFCPEDYALSIEAERKGYGIYLNKGARIVHQHGAASVPIYDIIWPVALQGGFLFVGRHYNRAVEMIIRSLTFMKNLAMCLVLLSRRRKDKEIWLKACKNAMRYGFSSLPPKELFERLARERGIL